MRPVISPVGDATLQKNFKNIQQALGGGISIDNMLFRVLEGTTSNTVDGQSKVIHSMTPRPVGWLPLIGDVYVQEINDKYVDVRATKPGVNFKIVLLGGPPVTGESLVAEGSQSYLSTTQVIQQTPVIEVTEVTDATINIKPLIVRSSVGKAILAGSGATNSFISLLNDSQYWYATQGTSANTNVLARLEKATGFVDTLTLGTRQLGPMCIQGDHLYVIQQVWDTVNSILIFDVDIPTFTLTSTFTITVSNTQDVSHIVVDGSNFYYTHRNGAGTQVPQVSKCSIGTSVATTLSLRVPTASTIAKRIIDDGTHLWIMDEPTGTAASFITKVLKSSMTVVSSTSIPTPGSAQMLAKNMVWDGTYFYFFSNLGGSLSNYIGNYAAAINIFDPVTLSFTTVPMVGSFQANSSPNTYTNARANIVLIDGFLYIPIASDTGLFINRFDTSTNQQALAWFPIFVGVNSTATAMATMLQIDPDDGSLVVVCNSSGTNATRNFEWFKPDFSSFV
jgi:hypothetical protein